MVSTEYEIEKLVRVLDKRLSDIGEMLKDIEKELHIGFLSLKPSIKPAPSDPTRTGNISLNREANLKKGAGRNENNFIGEIEKTIQEEGQSSDRTSKED